MTINGVFRATLLLTAVFLCSCGGGGGGGSGPGSPATAPPSGLQYSAAPAFVIQQPISPLTPTVTGSVSSYSVSPALPSGLSIDSKGGVISGTPTAISAQTVYTVTAANADGSTTATISIAVNDVKPSVGYGSPYFSFTANLPGNTDAAVHSGGGAILSWSVSPVLPAGLALSTTDGTISGTPTASSAPVTYTVTATNSGGRSTAAVTIAVSARPLLDIGHPGTVTVIRTIGPQVVSLESSGDWLLQDFASGSTIVRGRAFCGRDTQCSSNSVSGYPPVDMVGATMVAGTSADGVTVAAVEIRSSTDGHVLATVAGTFSWYLLAVDGSYLCTGSKTALTAWSTSSGQMLASHAGDYSTAAAFCAPGAMRVVRGPAGANVVEAVSASTGTSSVSPAFQGTFATWFADGTRFITTAGTAVWTYSSAGVQVDLTQVTGLRVLSGWGNYFWTYDGVSTVSVYQVGNSAAPALTYNLGVDSIDSVVIPSGPTIGILAYGAGKVTVIDLSGTTPTASAHTVPISYLSAYAATSSAAWLVANGSGVVFDGAGSRDLTLGAAWAISAGVDFFSVATASGQIFSYDAKTDALVSTINFPSSNLVASSSGAVFAAAAVSYYNQYSPDRTVRIYSLPTGTLIHSFPNTINGPQLVNLTLSGSGTALGQTFAYKGGGTCTAEVTAVTGAAPIFCDTTSGPQNLQLSPDTTRIAKGSGVNFAINLQTYFYLNAVLTGALPKAVPVVWLDNSRLLVNTYVDVATHPTQAQYNGALICDPSGNVLGSPNLPELTTAQVVAPDSVYSPQVNQIFSLPNGARTWASGNRAGGIGAATGTQVIFTNGNLVLAQPH